MFACLLVVWDLLTILSHASGRCCRLFVAYRTKKNAGNSQLVAFLSLSFTKLLLVCVCVFCWVFNFNLYFITFS